MVSQAVLKQVLESQKAELGLLNKLVDREIESKIDVGIAFAHIITGVRRSGKSTLLELLMRKNEGFYFKFEDTRISGFSVDDFVKLENVIRDEFKNPKRCYFDEIQNAEKWEIFVRQLLDKKMTLIISGSNASLLKSELGKKLTGRHLDYELFPFSFREYLAYVGLSADSSSFSNYLLDGGFPEYLKYHKLEVLQELFKDILERDIIIRNGIREKATIKKMALFLLSNTGKVFSYNSLMKTFYLGSVATAISFVGFFEDSYMLFTVPRFDYSFKKQMISPKKIYGIDTGFIRANTVSTSSDLGRLLENSVYLELRRKSKELFYHKEGFECDFLVKTNGAISQAIQVCYSLDSDNQERELNGLLEALKKYKLKEGLIITMDQEDEFKVDGKKILVKPAWKWMKEK